MTKGRTQLTESPLDVTVLPDYTVRTVRLRYWQLGTAYTVQVREAPAVKRRPVGPLGFAGGRAATSDPVNLPRCVCVEARWSRLSWGRSQLTEDDFFFFSKIERCPRRATSSSRRTMRLARPLFTAHLQREGGLVVWRSGAACRLVVGRRPGVRDEEHRGSSSPARR